MWGLFFGQRPREVRNMDHPVIYLLHTCPPSLKQFSWEMTLLAVQHTRQNSRKVKEEHKYKSKIRETRHSSFWSITYYYYYNIEHFLHFNVMAKKQCNFWGNFISQVFSPSPYSLFTSFFKRRNCGTHALPNLHWLSVLCSFQEFFTHFSTVL